MDLFDIKCDLQFLHNRFGGSTSQAERRKNNDLLARLFSQKNK